MNLPYRRAHRGAVRGSPVERRSAPPGHACRDILDSMADRQAHGELTVFRAFVSVCPLPIRTDLVENRPPPEPDIICHVEGEGAIAFEMTEIVDEGVARRLDAKLELQQQLQDSCQQLPAADQAKIEDMNVYVSFEESASLRSKERTVPKIVEWLKQVPPPFVGDIQIPDGELKVLKRVNIRRLDLRAPLFSVAGAGTYRDMTVTAIARKLSGSYAGASPKELLAYYGIQGLHPPELWQAELDVLLKHELPASPFRRVWVFDCGSKSIVYVRPQPDPTTSGHRILRSM